MKNAATPKQTKQQSTTPATNLPRHCQHVMTSGEFCRSVALRGRKYCHFHLIHLGRRIRAERRHEIAIKHNLDLRYIPMDLPLLEDANSIQLALSHVIDAVMNHAIDEKRAGLVLYALQTAVLNLRNGVNLQPSADAELSESYDDLEKDFDLHDAAPELKLESADTPNRVPQPAAQVATPKAAISTLASATAPARAANQPMAQPALPRKGPRQEARSAA